jgi:hypothetical protein
MKKKMREGSKEGRTIKEGRKTTEGKEGGREIDDKRKEGR